MGRSVPCSQHSNITIRSEHRKPSSICNIRKSTRSLKIDYGFLVFSVGWERIKYMIYASYILNAIVIISSLCLLCIAFRILVNISQYIIMISIYDGYIIPTCIIVVAFLSLIISTLLIYVTKESCVKCKNECLNNIFFLFIVMCFVISLIVIALSILTFFQKKTLDCRIHDGILEGMQNYNNDCHMKRKIDTLQVTFQCCGSNGFDDWFAIKWFDSSTETCANKLANDATPFSCCSLHSKFTCIHHNILSVGSAYLYAPESNLSISEFGCLPTLKCYTKSLIWRIALCFLILGLLLLCITCLSRFIQSAHMELYRFHRGCYMHTSWLLGRYRGKNRKRCRKPPVPPPFPCELCSP